MIQIQFAPILGILFGLSYYNDEDDELSMHDDIQHGVQIALFLIVIDVIWYTEKK